MFRKLFLLVTVGAMAFTSSAQAAEKIKIGVVTTLTTPASLIGKQLKFGMEIAAEHLGYKMSGKDFELLFEDDALNPKQGKQKTEKLVKKDKVDFLTGYVWSHVLAASVPVGLKAGLIVISANAGHAKFSGKACNKNFFNIAWENSQTPMAMGELLNKKGVKSLYVLSLNYAAGKQMVGGVERTFKGKIVGKDLVPLSHKDWSAELSKVKAAKPDGVFIFYPGKWGPAFFTQYQQAGLSGTPLYNVFSIDGANLPFFQKRKMTQLLGMFNTNYWAPDLDNPQNKRFVADFKKKYGTYPAHFAAQAYDVIMLIDAGVKAAGGNYKDTDAVRAGMEKADFPSLRGKLVFGKNHFPIQNFYSREVVKDANGDWVMSLRETVLKNHAPVNSHECKM